MSAIPIDSHISAAPFPLYPRALVLSAPTGEFCPAWTSLMGAALAYARRGWPVFPLRPGAKQPLPGSRGFHDATTDAATIRRWWVAHPDANVGIATGARSGLLVVDVDRKNGIDGDAALAALEAEHGALPATGTTATPNGGQHLLFHHPGGSIPCSASKLGPGLDVRADGGYIVAPPSIVGGKRYQRTVNFDHLAEAPGWLVELARQEPAAVRGVPAPGDEPRVAAGQRNDSLTRLAGSMRRQAASIPAIEAALLAHNEVACDPPLPAGEVRDIARGMGRYAPAPEGNAHLTDAGNAQRLVRRHGADLRFCPPLRRWLIWDGTRWRFDDDGEVMRRALETARAIYTEAAGEADDKRRAALGRWAHASESRAHIEAMVALARNLLPVSPKLLDADPWLLGVENGVLNLRTGELREAQREDYITKCAPVVFDPAAQCPRWLAFLERIMDGDQDRSAFLRRALGYSLTGQTGEQCLFLLHGTGANGKSVFLRTAGALLGDYATQTPAESLMVRRGEGASNDIARLRGARFVAANEVEDGQRLAESRVKQLTGGDVVAARFLFGEFFEFTPRFKLWLAANHKPVIRGDDEAIWRRIHLVPFNVTIPEAERDPALAERLREELPGILNWAAKGCRQWQVMGLGVPEAVREATAGYRSEMDAIRSWMAEQCVVQPSARAQAKALYENYKAWAGENDGWVVTQTKFGRRLAEMGFEKRRAPAIVYQGIGLRADEFDF